MTDDQSEGCWRALGALLGAAITMALAWAGWNYLAPVFRLPTLTSWQFLVMWFVIDALLFTNYRLAKANRRRDD